MSKFSRYLVALAVFVFCTASLAVGQTTTRISGTVRDTADAVVPGVKITLVDRNTKEEKTVNTNDDGVFVIVDVRPGFYLLTAERANFKKLQVQSIEVNVDKPVVLTLALEAGGVAETVSVTASDAQSLIRSEDAKLSTTVDVRQVQDLPLNGRNPINLAGGMAGVNSNTNIRQSVINGLRGSFSNITWDGIEINDNLVRTDSLFGVNTPSVAGVAEFSLTTQNAGPDEGVGIAQVKLTTPRGGNKYHGSLYDFYRNDKFDANTFFNNNTVNATTGLSLAKPILLQHQYGGNIGGPFAFPRFGENPKNLIQEGKLFFYFFYEKTNTTQDFSPNRTVLRDAARTGNFTYLATCGAGTAPACPAGIVNNQPITVNVLTKTGLTIDPKMLNLINLTPPSNNSNSGDGRNTGGFRFNTPNGSTGRNIGFRIDYDISTKHRVEAIYSHFLSILPNDVQLNNIGEQFPGLPGGGQQSARPRVSLAWHWSPSSNISNEARAGFSSSTPLFFNREQFAEGYRLGLPLITNPVQTFLQQGRAPRNYDIMDNLTWVKGNHVLKAGAQARLIRILNFNDGGTIPLYNIGFNSSTNPQPAGIASGTFVGGISSSEQTNAANLLALLTGNVANGSQTFNIANQTSGFSRGVGSVRHLDYNTLGLYVGDTWRFRENLSLNIGLRWEYIGPVYERDGLGIMPSNLSLAALNDPKAELVFAGKGTGRNFTDKDMNNFAPNFSFAWDPFKSGKTSIRGGFAVSYAIDNNATVLSNSSVAGNAGLQSTVTQDLSGTVSGTGIATLATPVFKMPRTIEDNLTLSQAPTLFTTEYNLATPYAAQWNFGVEREIFKDTAFSIGYVGNRGVQLTRGIDTNQVLIFENGFFQDFLRAQSNLAKFNNPACSAAQAAATGCQQLLIFPRLSGATPVGGAAIPAGGNLGNATIRTLLTEGRVGELASTYLNARCTYFVQNPVQGCLANFRIGPSAPSAGFAALGTEFFLPANKNAFVTDYVGSSGWSDYHGLQAEIRKRLTNGWYYQVNYTWSKAFTNAEQAQAEFSPYLDNTIGDPLEKKRNNQDVQHSFKANAVYELPFGPGKAYMNSGGLKGKLFGGWQISGIANVRTGRPISFISGRGTLNRNARSGNNTANTTLTIPELQAKTGLFYNPNTGLPLLFDPTLINLTNGRANPTFFSQPAAGTFGQLSLTPVDGPGYWNVDTALIKRTKFSESLNLELRLEAFNVFNHTNFSVGNSQDINSTDFGKITAAFDPRILQLSFKFNF